MFASPSGTTFAESPLEGHFCVLHSIREATISTASHPKFRSNQS